MESLLIVLCTFPNLTSARQIGTVMVERQLAACVNLMPAVESIYRWEGRTEHGSEVMAIFKTTRASMEAFHQLFLELHPYDVPELIALEADQVSEPYAAWVFNNVANSDQ